MKKYMILSLETFEFVLVRKEYYPGMFSSAEHVVTVFYLSATSKKLPNPGRLRVDPFKVLTFQGYKKAKRWVKEYCEAHNYDETLFELVRK